MAEELAFARKASGIVRGLSMLDAFGVGLMNQGITPSIWTMITWGLGTYLTGNLLWACIISLVLVGFGFPLVWGILSGSMPRSGGEYIYNSRIIHPIVGIAESFGNAFVMIFWVYVLAPWIADPGLVILGRVQQLDLALRHGHRHLLRRRRLRLGRVHRRHHRQHPRRAHHGLRRQDLRLHPEGDHVPRPRRRGRGHRLDHADQQERPSPSSWDKLAVQYDSLKYSEVVPAVSAAIGEAVPTSSDLYGTLGVMVAGSWLFAYAYFCVFVAGEVKRPDKTLIGANFIAILVPALLRHLDGALDVQGDALRLHLGDRLDRQQRRPRRLQPALPAELHEPRLRGPLELVRGRRRRASPTSSSPSGTWRSATWPSRASSSPGAWTAWVPKWFTSINPRWASPVKNYILCFVLCQAAIALYTFWLGDYMQGLTITGMEIVSVWGITTIAALIFPYVKRAKGIWESSPYKTWKFLGIPLVSWGAAVSLIYLGILFYFLHLHRGDEGLQRPVVDPLLHRLDIGVVWYFFWKSRSKKVGVDVGMTYGELPPE